MHKSKVVLLEKSDIWTKFHPIVSIYVVEHPGKEEKATHDEEILAQWKIFHQDLSILELKS